jgi:Zn-dependent peptidase ImmA (M78 family)
VNDYYSLLRYLRKNLSLPRRFTVRRVKLPKGLCGDCSYTKRRFAIRINKRLPQVAAIDTLLHEIGHCLAWHDDKHGRDWGAAYSKAYRYYLNWLSEQNEAEAA